MHILLTNDDGIDAPGLPAMRRAIDPEHRVTVVAPVDERSSCGHAATMSERLAVRRLEHEAFGEAFSVGGTPVDCVRLALAELVKIPIDVVLSGINRGANVSVVDVSQSGTVAAAREAAFCGIRGIAVSQMFRKGMEVDWARSTQTTAVLLPQLFDVPTPPACFWNVNIPALNPDEKLGGVRVVPLSRDQIPLVFADEPVTTDDTTAYRYRGFYETRRYEPGTDVAAVFGNEVAVTPIGIDPTHTPSLDSSLRFRG